MEDHTIKLLQECSKGCKMAIKSMNQVEEYVTDAKLRKVIDRYKEEHQKFDAEADKLLMWHGDEAKEPDMMAKAMSWMNTEVKMMMKDSDHQAATIMMNGCNMGIQTLCAAMKDYAGASNSSKKLAGDLIQSEERFRNEMKAYL